MASSACRSCGAALSPGADRCDLCGTPAGAHSDDLDLAAMPFGGAGLDDATASDPGCPTCGHANPPDARFCNACGSALTPSAPAAPLAAAPSPVTEATGTRPPSDVGKQALALVGIGLAVVVGLYGLSVWSEGRVAPSGAADGGPVAAAPGALPAASPIPDETPVLPDTAQAAADALEAQDTAEAWYESGRYYLTAAFQSTQSNPVASAQWARRAITSFERSLALQPNPNVRLALAEAATFDPSNPMRPVQELQALLTEYPDHPGGNFLLGERRLMIGRIDSAAVSFRRALAAAEPGDPVIARAQQGLDAVRSARENPTGN